MTQVKVCDSFYQVVEDTAKELYIKSLKDLPPDARDAIKAADKSEQNATGKKNLEIMLETINIADTKNRLICQDTGIPNYFAKIGNNLIIDFIKFEAAVRKGTQRATTEHPLRSSVVSPFGRKNNQNSTGYRIPTINYEFIENSELVDLLMVPKGSGSENMSFIQMLIPAAGVNGVKKFILETIVEKVGANPCPPYIVGIGVGGTSDLCMKMAKLAATTRPVGSKNPDPEMAALEEEMLQAINELNIGPMGLGGINTAIAVHVEHAYTHITQNPVAINIQCWPARRARAIITADAQVEIGF